MTLALIDALQDRIASLDVQGLRRRRRTTHSACAPQLVVDGQRVLSFNSNDYLGLAADARIATALQ
ncbi:MAG: 8-amino-7-oxononanoate synthase, partial [Curvibacter sp.]